MKKKIFALSLAAAILSLTAACTTARNDGTNQGTMAENGVQDETNALSNTGTGGTNAATGSMTNTNYNPSSTDTTRINTTRYNTDQTVTEADNLNGSNNGVIMDDTDEVVGGAVKDTARGVADIAEDLVDETRETGISGTDTMR